LPGGGFELQPAASSNSNAECGMRMNGMKPQMLLIRIPHSAFILTYPINLP
jgi:hypothetical protein